MPPPNCDGTAEEESGLENVKQSSCFGHVKGKHPRGDWVGTWINELAGERKRLAGNTKLGIIGMGWYASYRTKQKPTES